MQVQRFPQMASLGAAVIVDRDFVAIDASLDHDQAVKAIREVLEDIAHPDAIEHWVESVLPRSTPLVEILPFGFVFGEVPTTTPDAVVPLPAASAPAAPARSTVPNRATRRASARKRHKKPSRPAKIAGRGVSALGGATVAGLATMMVLNPGMAAAEAWDNPIFLRVASMADMDCHPLEDMPLRAQCTTGDGLVVNAEAMVGADSVTYTFTGFGESRAVVKVFANDRAVNQWVSSISSDSTRFPNLVVGDRVALYGSDPKALEPFLPAVQTKPLSAEDVAPVILRASYAMGMIPGDLAEQMLEADETLGPPAQAGTPEPVQMTAMAVLTGDERLRSDVELEVDDPWVADANPVVPPRIVVIPADEEDRLLRESRTPVLTDPAAPSEPVTEPAPQPPTQTDPAPAPAPAPAPTPTPDPAPAPEP